jgi:3-deoxy-7-phosphoheptulonate synthase
MASGLSMPVGFKNSTEGNLQVAINAMVSSRHPHTFLGIDQEGRTCLVRTRGNPWAHLVLRGGVQPNYDPDSIAAACDQLRQAGAVPVVMVDCSHANSGRRFECQETVWTSVLTQRCGGNGALIGMMVESNLEEGSQKLPADGGALRYGVSITDECVGWSATERMLRSAHHEIGRASRP